MTIDHSPMRCVLVLTHITEEETEAEGLWFTQSLTPLNLHP